MRACEAGGASGAELGELLAVAGWAAAGHDDLLAPAGFPWVAERPQRRRALEDILAAVRAGRHDAGLLVAMWSVRWLRGPHTERAARKRAAVGRLLLNGHIVLLQEAYCEDTATGVWSGLWPATAVVASPARREPRGGRGAASPSLRRTPGGFCGTSR